ncbi:DUF2339 domain-containing protein [Aneurinibacillus aneurinilyticus]|uniref:DUF2339 domain-containing protein n=1 Tax=Aneurinibacillus aneurinilyticus TaxID=1391 RepID=UPI002E2056E7|nr:DUF2339 domain-containing protein [Aneurinibacillus aneurinilyticus]
MEKDQEFLELEKRIASLEQEVTRLKEMFHEKEAIRQPIKNMAPPPPASSGETQHKSSLSWESLAPEPEETDWEHLIGRIWLPRIFIVVLLLGVIWAFKVSIDKGLITEPVRVLLGFFASGAFLWLGDKQVKQQRHALGQVLLGGAVCLTMLTTFAMHALYDFIPALPAFLLNVVWIAGGMYLAYRYRSEALAILASLAGCLVPFLVESQEPSAWLFVGYEVVLYGGFLYFALHRQYIMLYLSSSTLLQAAFAAYAIGTLGDIDILAAGSVAQYAILLTCFLAHRSYTHSQTGVLFACFLLTLLWIHGGYDTTSVQWFLLSGFLLHGFLAIYFWKRNTKTAGTFLTVASFSLAFYFTHTIDNQPLIHLVILLEATAAFYAGIRLHSRLLTGSAVVLYLFGSLSALDYSIEQVISTETALWLGLVITFYSNIKVAQAHITPSNPNIFTVLYTVHTALMLLFLTRETNALAENLSFDMKHLAVSFVWVLYAVIAVLYGMIKKDARSRLFGVILIFVTLLKVIFIDLPNVSLLFRAILFIVLGGIGIAISRLFYTGDKDKKQNTISE